MNTILSRLASELINQAPIKDSQVSMILSLDFDGVLHPYPLHVEGPNAELFKTHFNTVH